MRGHDAVSHRHLHRQLDEERAGESVRSLVRLLRDYGYDLGLGFD